MCWAGGGTARSPHRYRPIYTTLYLNNIISTLHYYLISTHTGLGELLRRDHRGCRGWVVKHSQYEVNNAKIKIFRGTFQRRCMCSLESKTIKPLASHPVLELLKLGTRVLLCDGVEVWRCGVLQTCVIKFTATPLFISNVIKRLGLTRAGNWLHS